MPTIISEISLLNKNIDDAKLLGLARNSEIRNLQDIIVFAGKNGSGKTRILKVIEHLFNSDIKNFPYLEQLQKDREDFEDKKNNYENADESRKPYFFPAYQEALNGLQNINDGEALRQLNLKFKNEYKKDIDKIKVLYFSPKISDFDRPSHI